MDECGLRQGADGTFAFSTQHLTEEQQHILAKSISAMLCARTGVSSADPFLGNSRSSSPYMRPHEPSMTGSLDNSCIQLPPAAMALHMNSCQPRPSPLGAPQLQQQLLQHDSQSSHSTGHAMAERVPATATPISHSKVGMPGKTCCYGSSAIIHQQGFLHDPAFSVQEPVCFAAAARDTVNGAAQQQVEEMPSAHGTAACHMLELTEPAAVTQQACRRPCVMNSPNAWLYELVTCPFLFKPCPQCSATNSGREVLITYFDTDNPTHGYCTYCPQRQGRPRLLQIRRSTYHEVVKAADVSRLTDVSGIQHYVINGAKVLFLRPRPQPRPPKGVIAPARCAVDGRQLMDAHSSYCSLRCKLEVEDVIFAANFPSASEENQEETAAGSDSLAGTSHKQGGHEGRRVVVPNPRRLAAQSSALNRQQGQELRRQDDSSEDAGDAGDGSWSARHKRARHMPSKYANAVVGGSYQLAVAGNSRGTNVLHRNHHYSSNKVRDDTASDQAAAYGAAAAAAAAVAAACTAVSPAGVAGLHLLHRGTAAAEAGSRRSSPCDSEDSGRSTTCVQRATKKRKRAPPSRSALQ